ncbi:MAG: hypothetical protein NO475_03655 [Candidatus Methanomethylicia archaeon]|nr:hypothetical protein [Candidatus Methanomethylicia archaeon]
MNEEKIKIWNFEIQTFNKIIRFMYFDQGADMDIYENYLVKITKDGVEVKQISGNIDTWELYENYDELKEKVFYITGKIFEKIHAKICPRCGRKLKIIESKHSKKPSEYGAFLSKRYKDLSKYDEEINEVFTCKCGLRIKIHYDTWDGGAVLNWKHEIEDENGNKAILEKIGYHNEYRHFWENINFIDDLIKMANKKVK